MHPTPEELIDYAEEKIGVEIQRRVEEHLRRGCPRCERRLLEYRIITASLEEGPLEDPSPQLVDAAIRLFHRTRTSRASVANAVQTGVRIARLVFDSSRPDLFAPLSVRGSQTERRLRFEDERFELDLLLAPIPEGIQITAQALAASPQAGTAAEIRFCIQSGETVVARGQCDRFGEFDAVISTPGALRILLEDSEGPVRFDIPE